MPQKQQRKDRDHSRDKEMDKDKDKDRDKEKDKEKSRHRKSSRSHRRSSLSPEGKAKSSSSSVTRRRKTTTSEGKMSRSSHLDFSPSASRTSLPYPSFSKAHSKECVTKDIKVDIFTPNPTDLGATNAAEKDKATPGAGSKADPTKEDGHPPAATVPPSPPLTSLSVGRGDDEAVNKADEASRGDHDVVAERPAAGRVRSTSDQGGKARVSPAQTLLGDEPRTRTPLSKTSPIPSRRTSPANAGTAPVVVIDVQSGTSVSEVRGASAESTVDSEATSATEVITVGAAPSRTYSAVRTPGSAISQRSNERSNERLTNKRPPGASRGGYDSSARIGTPLDAPHGSEMFPPQPPPPPPPPMRPAQIPRVDYLLQHGGLTHSVPRTLILTSPDHSSTPESPDPSQERSVHFAEQPLRAAVQQVFTPYTEILDQYETVMAKNGSIAVATGYRSVARRLLDRLEAVFARDISSESCVCSLCQDPDRFEADEPGLGWGDVLEWVSGRKPVPPWPLFDFGTLRQVDSQGGNTRRSSRSTRPPPSAVGTDASRQVPMDIDVPDEFREHYKKQTKKTKAAVDRWLASQITQPTPTTPQEIDDETLTFAILTHLHPDEREAFNELLASSGSSASCADSDSEISAASPRSEVLSRTGAALQRLYRLTVPPREPECAAFLVKHPSLHKVLATLAAVTPSEWDVLTSGRFDGFLWSGAEDPVTAPSALPSRGSTPWKPGGYPPASREPTPFSMTESASRTTTPFHGGGGPLSRGPTPAPGSASNRAVSVDEETEIAVLAEVEREIYLGMEALEDAFEALHQKAERVRQALRERGAGLSMAGQPQVYGGGRGSDANPFNVGRGTPGIGGYSFDHVDDSEDDYRYSHHHHHQHPYQQYPFGAWTSGLAGRLTPALGGDAASDVWPDDSASNISTNRVRRPKRRNERRTPAPVDEEDEEEDER